MGKTSITPHPIPRRTLFVIATALFVVLAAGIMLCTLLLTQDPRPPHQLQICLLLSLIAGVLLDGGLLTLLWFPLSDGQPPQFDAADTLAPGAPKQPALLERHSIDRLAARYEESDQLQHLGCFLLKIGNLSRINSEQGHEAGDQVIDAFCRILESVSNEYGQIGRNGGNEYLTIIENCDHTVSDLFLMDVVHQIQSYNDAHPELPIEVSYACVLNDEAGTTRFFGLIARTYQKYEGGAQLLI